MQDYAAQGKSATSFEFTLADLEGEQTDEDETLWYARELDQVGLVQFLILAFLRCASEKTRVFRVSPYLCSRARTPSLTRPSRVGASNCIPRYLVP